MIIRRVFRGTNIPSQLFANYVICLEKMGIALTKNEVLKYEGDDFDGIIIGNQISPAGRLIIRINIHSYRDMNHPWFPGMITTEVTSETLEVSEDNKELPNTSNATVLNEEFNKRINMYVWHGPG